MKVSDLKPNPKNPRTISPEKLSMLKNALMEFGDLSGIVYNRKSGQLIGGHQRREILNEANIVIEKKYAKPTVTGTVAEGFAFFNGERFTFREVSWSKHKEMAANLAANKNAGDWDMPIVGEFLKELSSFDVNFDINLTMFDKDELTSFGGITVSEHTRTGKTGVDEDEVPEKAPPRTKLSDIYQLGRHRLMCGDSTDLKSVEKLMNGEKAKLLITDPPYGVSYVEKNAAVHGGIVKNAINKEIKNDSGTVQEMGVLWAALFANADFFTDKASYYVFSPQGGELMMMMMMQAISQSPWQLKHTLVWAKQNFVFGRSDYHYQHEPILFGWKKKGTHNWYADRSQSSLLEFDKPHRSDLHPTTKPVEIVEYLMGNSSQEKDLVCDLFGGSGSTLIAAEKTNRNCYMMELDPGYCDVIVERWEKYTGNKAKLISQKTKLKKKLDNNFDNHMPSFTENNV